jgi:hypothetical protein
MAIIKSHVFAALACIPLCAAAAAVVAQQAPRLDSSTPEYKCHVYSMTQGDTIIRFYELSELPARFSDAETFARASVPESVRNAVQIVHECVLLPEQFSNPAAEILEQQLPR